MEKGKIRVALIASGSGTDAYAIMNARNTMPEIDIRLLISTKTGAGCLDKAKECNITSVVIDRRELGSEPFNRELFYVIRQEKIELIFLVGCIVKIPLILGVAIYNIHPANIEKFGGKGMYGLEPHKKVLQDIEDQIRRGRKLPEDEFYTEPTVHEAVARYDDGQYLLKMQVEIPRQIIEDFMSNNLTLEESAGRLQKHVLPYEWMMLPLAVKAAANKLRQELEIV